MMEFIAVDWGSTRLRLRLLGEEGPPIAETATDGGVGIVPAGGHEAVFLEAVERLLDGAGRREAWRAAGGEVWLAGMVTSTLGWIPTPYIDVPAGAAEILGGLRVERLGGLLLHLLPGLRTADDVIRGEEVEAVGLLGGPGGPREATLVLPGTHSKWIEWRDGRIEGFLTVPTGDLHAGLHRSTLLARTLPPGPADPAGGGGALLGAFDGGVDLARRDGPLAALFKVRALPVLAGLEPERASALLSGILIGGEVLERAPARPAGRPIIVGGAPRLRDLYLRALGRLGVAASGVDPDLAARASAEGLRTLRRRAGGKA